MSTAPERFQSFPASFALFGVLRLNGRMTAMGLEDGGVVLHSPIGFTQARKEAVEALGPVRAIVAPNLFHHLYVGDWLKAFPDALSFAPARLHRKRPDLRIDHELGPAFDEHFGADIVRVHIEGIPAVREHLFYHRASKTLVVTDFSFYLPNATGLTKWYAKLNGVSHAPACPFLFRQAIRVRDAFQRSLRPLYALDVQRISMCHDEIYTGDANARLHQLLETLGVARA